MTIQEIQNRKEDQTFLGDLVISSNVLLGF